LNYKGPKVRAERDKREFTGRGTKLSGDKNELREGQEKTMTRKRGMEVN